MGAMSFSGVLLEITKGLPLFIERVDRAVEAGTSGFVLGATSYVPNVKDNIDQTIAHYRNLKDFDERITSEMMSDVALGDAILMRNSLFKYIVKKMETHPHILALVPGFGRQGGNLEFFLDSGINPNRCMFNEGSDAFKAEDINAYLVERNKIYNSIR